MKDQQLQEALKRTTALLRWLKNHDYYRVNALGHVLDDALTTFVQTEMSEPEEEELEEGLGMEA